MNANEMRTLIVRWLLECAEAERADDRRFEARVMSDLARRIETDEMLSLVDPPQDPDNRAGPKK